MAALRLVAQRSNRDASPDTLSRVFGAQWNAPAAWSIISINIGQEVHRGDGDDPSFILGSLSSLSVGDRPD